MGRPTKKRRRRGRPRTPNAQMEAMLIDYVRLRTKAPIDRICFVAACQQLPPEDCRRLLCELPISGPWRDQLAALAEIQRCSLGLPGADDGFPGLPSSLMGLLPGGVQPDWDVVAAAEAVHPGAAVGPAPTVVRDAETGDTKQPVAGEEFPGTLDEDEVASWLDQQRSYSHSDDARVPEIAGTVKTNWSRLKRLYGRHRRIWEDEGVPVHPWARESSAHWAHCTCEHRRCVATRYSALQQGTETCPWLLPVREGASPRPSLCIGGDDHKWSDRTFTSAHDHCSTCGQALPRVPAVLFPLPQVYHSAIAVKDIAITTPDDVRSAIDEGMRRAEADPRAAILVPHPWMWPVMRLRLAARGAQRGLWACPDHRAHLAHVTNTEPKNWSKVAAKLSTPRRISGSTFVDLACKTLRRHGFVLQWADKTGGYLEAHSIREVESPFGRVFTTSFLLLARPVPSGRVEIHTTADIEVFCAEGDVGDELHREAEQHHAQMVDEIVSRLDGGR